MLDTNEPIYYYNKHKCCNECTHWDKEERNNKMEDKKEITVSKEEFMAYESVRRLGHHNMFTGAAREMTNLDKETYIEIIEHYDIWSKKYMDDNGTFGGVSNCCGALFMYPGWPDNDICSRCKEHSGLQEEEDKNE